MNIDNLKNAKHVTVKFKEEEMSAYTLARWLAIMEAIDVINQSAEKMNVDLNKYNQWVKPIAFQKYINERTYGLIADVLMNEDL